METKEIRPWCFSCLPSEPGLYRVQTGLDMETFQYSSEIRYFDGTSFKKMEEKEADVECRETEAEPTPVQDTRVPQPTMKIWVPTPAAILGTILKFNDGSEAGTVTELIKRSGNRTQIWIRPTSKTMALRLLAFTR